MTELSPEQKAQILIDQIHGYFKQTSQDSESRELDETSTAEVTQLYNTTGQFLVDLGYQDQIAQIQADNEDYVNSLLIWSSGHRMLDALEAEYDQDNDYTVNLLKEIVKNNREPALKIPEAETYCEHLKEPYKTLMRTWFTLDRAIQRGRYRQAIQTMNDTINQVGPEEIN
jgi:hypothetical protein